MQEILSREVIVQTLRDAGCDECLIQRFLEMGESATLCDQLKLLSRHRCCLLEHMHAVQREIDCLDYLLWQLKKGIPMDCCCHEEKQPQEGECRS